MKTYIPGKDAALEDSINYFQKQLKKFNLEAKEASWLNPVPNVWSVHIQNVECPLCFSNGKGSSKKSALASALGEYFERLSTNYYFSDFYLGQKNADADFVHYPNEKWFAIDDEEGLPKGLLSKKLLKFYDPDNELTGRDLIDLQSSNMERGICALPFVQQSDQKTVYVPVNLIANLYASNGMAAGNTQNEARVQALSEIFERAIKNKVIAEAISLPEIPTDILKSYPNVFEAIATLEQEGFPLYCYDCSLGGVYPVICVVLFNPKNGTCFASFGAHPDFGVALERTVTELLQGRSLKDLDVFSPPSFDNDDVADLSNLETHFIDSSGSISWDLFKKDADYPFVHWNFSGETKQEFANLMQIMNKQKTEVLIMDYEHLGVYTCRILAVGMSEIYPPEDLILANNNMAIHWRDTILSLPKSKLPKREYLALIEQLDDDSLDDFARVRELLGLATGANNAWYTLRIGELKGMLALAGGDLEQALEWVDWTIEFNQSIFSAERNHDYRCLKTLVEFALSRKVKQFGQYQPAFNKMYGEECVNKMWQVVQGKIKFEGLFAINTDLHQLPVHQNLMSVYQKLHTALKV
nr:30S ribosomal protein S12 methylthiotransferase accessory factor YcaO [Zophobihabitans entericus]